MSEADWTKFISFGSSNSVFSLERISFQQSLWNTVLILMSWSNFMDRRKSTTESKGRRWWRKQEVLPSTGNPRDAQVFLSFLEWTSNLLVSGNNYCLFMWIDRLRTRLEHADAPIKPTEANWCRWELHTWQAANTKVCSTQSVFFEVLRVNFTLLQELRLVGWRSLFPGWGKAEAQTLVIVEWKANKVATLRNRWSRRLHQPGHWKLGWLNTAWKNTRKYSKLWDMIILQFVHI